jgi:putative aminopeptidase FrvX
MTYRAKPLLLSLAILAAPSFAQKISYEPVSADVLHARLAAVPRKNADRFAEMKKQFEDAGCKGAALTEQAVRDAKLPNLVCTLKGESDDKIIVGAHFDQSGGGEGAVSNWTGASLLPSLYQSIKGESRHLTFVFVGFTDQEKGLVGSKAMVKDMSKDDLSHIKAMINIDSIGMTPTKVFTNSADKTLLKELSSVAHSMTLELKSSNPPGGSQADSEPFASKKVPSLDVNSFAPENGKIMHSSGDILKAVVFQNYADTYKLMAAYLSYVDAMLAPKAAAGTR